MADGTEKKTEQSNTAQKNNANKPDWEKYALVVSIIGLIISSSLTAGLAFYSFQLTEQANRLTERSLELQNMQTNYTLAIITNPNQIAFLDGDGHFQNDTSTSCFGWLNGSVTVISPYYGTLSIYIINFTVSDDYRSLLPAKVNLTHVSPLQDYLKMYENIPVVTGLNPTFNFSFLLGASMYPDPQKLPSPQGIFVTPIGFLLLEAKIDSLTGSTFPKYFYAQIFVTIRNY